MTTSAPSPSAEPTAEPVLPADEPARRRVVLAEDEALIRLDLKEMLQEEGYEVVGEAGDGQTAVELVEQLRPDLCIFDVKMPVLDGISRRREGRQGPLGAVLMLTAFSQRELVERARDAGAMAYLVKPFAKHDLLPAIEMAVSRYAEIVALEGEVGDLQGRLEARKLVDRAKAVLQNEYGFTESAAFRFVQKTSMDRRLTMRGVAEAILTGDVLPDTSAPAEQLTLRGATSESPDPAGFSHRRPRAARSAGRVYLVSDSSGRSSCGLQSSRPSPAQAWLAYAAVGSRGSPAAPSAVVAGSGSIRRDCADA